MNCSNSQNDARLPATYSTGRSEVQRQMHVSWLSATTTNALHYHHSCRFYSEWSSHALHTTSNDTRHKMALTSITRNPQLRQGYTNPGQLDFVYRGNQYLRELTCGTCFMSPGWCPDFDVATRLLEKFYSHELRYFRLSERWGFTLWSPELWHLVAWYEITDISGKPAGLITVKAVLWKSPTNRRSILTLPHRVSRILWNVGKTPARLKRNSLLHVNKWEFQTRNFTTWFTYWH